MSWSGMVPSDSEKQKTDQGILKELRAFHELLSEEIDDADQQDFGFSRVDVTKVWNHEQEPEDDKIVPLGDLGDDQNEVPAHHLARSELRMRSDKGKKWQGREERYLPHETTFKVQEDRLHVDAVPTSAQFDLHFSMEITDAQTEQEIRDAIGDRIAYA